MTKTKRMNLRTSVVAVVSGILLLGALVLPAGFASTGSALASQESRALDDWNGTWVNIGTMLDDPAMGAVYEAMADAANAAAGTDGAFSVDDARSFLYAMHRSNFGNLRIAGNTITYYSVDGTVRCECECESAGAETVAFEGEEFDWYKFELTSKDTACSEYKYLILCEQHSDGEGGMLHFHMRYGDTSFDDLINNPAYAMWYPTFGAEGTTLEDVADGYAAGAEMMGYMMLASQSLKDPWKNFDPDFLSAEVIDVSGTYRKTGEGISLYLEGNLIPASLEQLTGTVVIEQHGSLLKAIDTTGEEKAVYQGSTIGNNIMLSSAGYTEIPGMGKTRFECVSTGTIEEGIQGPKIILNWVWRFYDSDNNLLLNGAGTQVLTRVEG